MELSDNHLFSHDHLFRHDVLDFVSTATQFCIQLEQCEGSERGEFTQVMQQLLPVLYYRAASLEEIEEYYGYVQDIVTEQDYDFVRLNMAMILREDDDFLDVYHPDSKYADSPVVSTISECLADCYQSLRNMVETFRQENEEAMQVSLYECLQDFRSNWGMRLLGALTAIHQVIAAGGVDEL